MGRQRLTSQKVLDRDSAFETAAQEVMVETIEYIVKAYGFTEFDIENAIATSQW